ncbi:MAG: DUF2085 domain-containing protein [Candidatus Jordarchaeales archaeon]
MSSLRSIKKILLFLLSHHSEEYAHRTLRIRFFSSEVRLCARCSGLTLGFIFGIAVYYCFWKWLFLSEATAVALVIFSLMPALLDWGTQSVFRRESKNWLRVITGFLLGFGITFTRFISIYTFLLLVLLFYSIAATIIFVRVRKLKE